MKKKNNKCVVAVTHLCVMRIRTDVFLSPSAAESEENKALSVEMGAYNVLTMAHLTKAGEGNYFGDALAAVRWINEQRNSQGGFVSTQASGRNSVPSSHAE